jgi:hypothetical protein
MKYNVTIVRCGNWLCFPVTPLDAVEVVMHWPGVVSHFFGKLVDRFVDPYSSNSLLYLDGSDVVYIFWKVAEEIVMAWGNNVDNGEAPG